MSTCFTRDVLTGCILYEQMISFVRESNDSPSEFLHPRTCVTEEILTWSRNRDISRDAQKRARHRFRGRWCDTSFNYRRSGLLLFFFLQRAERMELVWYRNSIGNAWCVFRFTFWQSLKYISILSGFGICGLIYSTFIKSIWIIKGKKNIFNFSLNSCYYEIYRNRLKILRKMLVVKNKF